MKEVSGLLQLVGVLLGFGVMLMIEIFGKTFTKFCVGLLRLCISIIVGPHHEHGDHDHEHEAESFHMVRRSFGHQDTELSFAKTIPSGPR